MHIKSHVRGGNWTWGISTLHGEATDPEKESDFLSATQILAEHENKNLVPASCYSPQDLGLYSNPHLFPGHSSTGVRGILYGRDSVTPAP